MSRYKWWIILLNLVVVVLLFNWSVINKERTLSNGKLVLLHLAPVDPRSLMQGDYMSLNYAIASTNEQYEYQRGYIVVTLDEHNVAAKMRLQQGTTPLAANEQLIKFRKTESSMNIGAESYFFEEGTGEIYEKAEYGALKIDDDGNSILVGLYDEHYQLIKPQPDSTKK